MKSIISIITMAILALQTLNAQQEKRLALVIGNANYDKGALNNPVNDALLMAETLEALDFEVILDTNIALLEDFNTSVRKFGDIRPNYDVGFIYYAEHGVQMSDNNYLLATKEQYNSETDVKFNGLSVEQIMLFLTSIRDQVNVLILDACRNNPFEKKWSSQSRSIDAGRGLARLQVPTGSMIAYSTKAGQTADDGENENSIYCKSLTKNMLKLYDSF